MFGDRMFGVATDIGHHDAARPAGFEVDDVGPGRRDRNHFEARQGVDRSR